MVVVVCTLVEVSMAKCKYGGFTKVEHLLRFWLADLHFNAERHVRAHLQSSQIRRRTTGDEVQSLV